MTNLQTRRTRWTRRAVALLAGLLFAPTFAMAEYFTSYAYTPNQGSWAIGGIIKFEDGRASWPDTYDGCSPPAGSCPTQVVNQVFGASAPLAEALLVGVAYNGLFDGFSGGIPITGAQPHVVLFVDSSKAPLLLGRPFEGLFPGFTEAQVGGWIESVGLIGTPPLAEQDFLDTLSSLSGFVSGLRTFDPTGFGLVATSLWIPLPADQSVEPRQFTAVMFTDGNSVGTGTASQRFERGAEVPTPTTLALLALGILSIGCARRVAVAPRGLRGTQA